MQYKALMATEGVDINFTESVLNALPKRPGRLTKPPKTSVHRRLHTVLERLMEDISYDASDLNGQSITIDAEYVSKHLDALVADEDLSRFIL